MKKGFFFVFLALYALSVGAQEITNVSFTQEGEVSKLIIEADKALISERFHVTEDKQIILDIKNAKVSPKLLRGIDTSEFPGSTVYISGYRKPGTTNDVRFAIQLRDNVRSVLETKDNKIILNIENRFGVFTKNQVKSTDVKAAKSQENFEDAVGINVPKSTSLEDILENLTLSGPKKYVGRRISINVRDIPVTDVLNMIADTSGFNIIIDREVGQMPPITLSLTNVPWDQALDTIMKLSKLVAEKNANILIMKTAKQAAEEQKAVTEQQKAKEAVEPLVTRVFLINYATLTDINKVITDYITKDRGKIQTDDRTNSIIVRDTVETIDRIKKIIETLDTQTPQILIEAKIVEASENYTKRLGLTSGITFGYDPVVDTTARNPVGPGFSFSTAPATNITTGVGLTIGIYKRLQNLSLNLEMLEQESKVRVVSSPRVVAQNKRPATLTATDTTPFQTNTISNGVTTTGFSNATATTSLNVTPQVTNDGAISMVVVVTKGSFGPAPSTGAPPTTVTRTVTTNVLVDNGSTVVIGGLYTQSESSIEAGIPYLKDLPLVGWLFRNPFNTTQGKTELVVFITPRILNQEEAGFSERRATNVQSDAEAKSSL
ncbi:MAG: type IV pilus secretin PilQ [Bacteriovoracaceae bacterium]